MIKTVTLSILGLLVFVTTRSENFVSNGDFELSTSIAASYWAANVTAPGVQTLSIDNTSQISGSNCIKADISTAGGYIGRLGCTLYFNLPKASTFTVTFKAKASANCTLFSNLTQWYDPYGTIGLSPTYNLTTSVQSFSYDITTTGLTGMCRFGFFYGSASAGTSIYIDDVSIVEKSPLNYFNLCNGDFETTMGNTLTSPGTYTANGLTSGTPNSTENSLYYGWCWAKLIGGTADATAAIDNVSPLSGAQSLKITSNVTANANALDTRLVWVMASNKDKYYVLSFKAKASQAFTMDLFLSAWEYVSHPISIIITQSCNLTTSVQTFNYVSSTYFSGTSTRELLTFGFGKLPKDVSVWLDDIVIQEKQTPTITFAQDLSGLLTGQGTVALIASSNFTSSSAPEASDIIFTSDNPSVVSVNGSTLTVVGVGTANITASQTSNTFYYAASSVVVPVTVSRATQTLSGANTAAALTNPTADITIPSGGTLTMNANKTVHNLTVASGGKITFDAVTPYILTVTGNVLLKSDGVSSFSAYLGAGGMAVSGTVSYDRTMDGTQWYFMAFPCDILVGNITKADGTALPLGSSLYVKYYDGLSRANLTSGSNWKNVAGGATPLKKDSGYIFGLPDNQGPYDVRFPLTTALLASESAHNIAVNENAGTHGATAINKGWNLVGMPYLSNYTASGANVNYLTLFCGGSYYTTYAKADAGTLAPFTAYFVQADASLAASGLTFAVGNRQQVSSVVATDMTDRPKIIFSTATDSDNTNLVINSSQYPYYQIGQDMVKWLTTGTDKPQIYTLLDGVNYAYNGLPIESVQNLPVGVYLKTTGAATISVDASQAPGLGQLLLMDNVTGGSTDLLVSDYHFTATAGTNNTRFSVSAFAADIATKDIRQVSNEPKLTVVRGKLLVTNIYGMTHIWVYNALGFLVANNITSAGSFEIPLKMPGVYTVQLQTGGLTMIRKIIDRW